MPLSCWSQLCPQSKQILDKYLKNIVWRVGKLFACLKHLCFGMLLSLIAFQTKSAEESHSPRAIDVGKWVKIIFSLSSYNTGAASGLPMVRKRVRWVEEKGNEARPASQSQYCLNYALQHGVGEKGIPFSENWFGSKDSACCIKYIITFTFSYNLWR